jgi:predicted lipid-binding transport protein (Tim44 family)
MKSTEQRHCPPNTDNNGCLIRAIGSMAIGALCGVLGYFASPIIFPGIDGVYGFCGVTTVITSIAFLALSRS